MRINLSVKWTLSAVFLIIIIVSAYAFVILRDTQASVEEETMRIQRVQYTALDRIGVRTTRYMSFPASSLLFDNDKQGLNNLISPIVDDTTDQRNYFAIYATIIDLNGRIWVASVNSAYDQLKLSGATFFDKSRGEPVLDEVPLTWLRREITSKTLPLNEDVERDVKTSEGRLMTVPVRQYVQEISGNDEIQGYLVVGYSTEAMNKEIEDVRAQGEVKKQAAMERALWVALLAIIAGIVMATGQSMLVARNVKKLSKAAGQIAKGDLTVRANVHSHDEIGDLGDQFNIMADRVQILLDQTQQAAMKQREMDIACEIQKTLLPSDGRSTCGPLDLYGYFQPASECGGDFWSQNVLSDGSILLTVGDVTGHGVPSAMITACAKSALDTLLTLSNVQGLQLAQIVESLNTAICKTAKRTLFMTFQAIRIQPDGVHAEFVNAGHNFPLWVHEGRMQSIVSRGERLGDNEHATYASVLFNLTHGDALLLYTDGLTEYQNAQGAEYGEKRLRKAMTSVAHLDVETLMRTVWEDFNEFRQDAPQHDDITLVFAKV